MNVSLVSNSALDALDELVGSTANSAQPEEVLRRKAAVRRIRALVEAAATVVEACGVIATPIARAGDPGAAAAIALDELAFELRRVAEPLPGARQALPILGSRVEVEVEAAPDGAA